MSLRSFGSIAALAAGAFVCVATTTLLPRMAIARPASVTKGDIEQLAVDLKVGMEHSHLTLQEKGRMRGDLEQLREARQNHEPLKGFEAAGRIREMVENDSFRRSDQDRIQSDTQTIPEARQFGDPLIDYDHWWNNWNNRGNR